jgi:uncharacterized membrane protein
MPECIYLFIFIYGFFSGTARRSVSVVVIETALPEQRAEGTWKGAMSKLNFIFYFLSLLDPAVLYGCETWSLTLRRNID